MPTLTYPGVHIEEISGGTRPLDVAGTSTAAFVGFTEMGPEEPTRVTNWTEFQRRYGSFIADGFLAYSVFQYFNNGGRQCYVVRVVRPDAATASVTVANRASAPVPGLSFSARNKGAWGNTLLLRIEDGTLDSGNEFKLTLRRQDDPAAVSAEDLSATPLEVFDNLSMDPAAPNYALTVLNQDSALINAQIQSGNSTAVAPGVHRGDFSPALPLGTALGFQISLDGDGFQSVALPAAAGTATDLATVAAAVQTAVRALQPKKTSTPTAAFTAFTCTVSTVGTQVRLVLQSGTTAATSAVRIQPGPPTDATEKLKLGAGNGGRSEDGIAVRRPAKADVVQVGDAAVAGPVTGVTLGGDGAVVPTDTTYSAVFPRLDKVTDFSLLAVPGRATTGIFDLATGYCANRPLQDIFYIGETGKDTDSADKAAAFRGSLTVANSYGALYFPWVRALDPTGRSKQPILLPPSGFLAGLYGRIDARRGVWKAPAGTEAGLNGLAGLAVELDDVQHGNLNPLGVDVIRRFTGAGVVAFGARTVSADPAWRYIPVRRTAIMLRVSIYNGIQWAVFEPNDEPLWAQLRLNIGSFMTTLFRQGAFQGSTPSQGFFVKCDSETTTQADIDSGVVNVLVGFAPLKPAEFVVVRISQKAGEASG